MFQKNTSGPCGRSFDEIIAMADRLGSQAATFGLTDPEVLNEFCSVLGEKLTKEFIRLGVTCDLESYEHRCVRIASNFTQAFIQTEFWSACADLGPYSGPPQEIGRLGDAAQAFLDSFSNMRQVLGVFASEILDLLAWLQCTLGVRIFCKKYPHIVVAKCDPRTVPMHT